MTAPPDPSTRPDPPPAATPAAAADPVLALIRDLMFVGRVTATATAAGVPLKVVRDPAKLPGTPGRRLIVDLNLDGAIDAAAAWAAAHAAAAAAPADVIGFVSHMDADTARRARAAGIDRVMARSQFVQVLPDLLST